MRVGGVFVSDDGIYFPAVGLFVFSGAVDDKTYGKDVVYFFKFHLVFAHLVQDGGDGFCPVFGFEPDAFFVEFVNDGSDESGDVFFAGVFCVAQFAGYFCIYAGIGIAECPVFHLRFDVIQSQTVGKRNVNVVGFFG